MWLATFPGNVLDEAVSAVVSEFVRQCVSGCGMTLQSCAIWPISSEFDYEFGTHRVPLEMLEAICATTSRR